MRVYILNVCVSLCVCRGRGGGEAVVQINVQMKNSQIKIGTDK